MSKPLLIPAIDLFSGQCVRLVKGDYAKMTTYTNDPIETALMMQDEGADIIHIVDLEGAKLGMPVHADLIGRIQKRLSIPVETGGGIRSLESVKILIDAGIRRIILGTISITDKDLTAQLLTLFPNQIILGLDVLDRNIAIKGWVEDSGVTIDHVIEDYLPKGLQEIIVTDIAQDGMLQGPNIDLLKGLVSSNNVKVIASGGVSSLADIEALCAINDLHGIIVGKAIYEGHLTVKNLRSTIDAA